MGNYLLELKNHINIIGEALKSISQIFELHEDTSTLSFRKAVAEMVEKINDSIKGIETMRCPADYKGAHGEALQALPHLRNGTMHINKYLISCNIHALELSSKATTKGAKILVKALWLAEGKTNKKRWKDG